MTNKADLPACPVETTLMLIGDKWKVLILRDLRNGIKAFRRTEKICNRYFPKGSDSQPPQYGGKRTADKRGFSGSAAESGIYTDGTWS